MQPSLKKATFRKHSEAEKMPYNIKMFKGELTPNQYLAHLNQQLAVFQAIEAVGLPHKALIRVPAIQVDIDELKAQGCDADEVLPRTQKYVDYISTLTKETVLPHVYLNYLAIMFGGQMMKEKVPSTGKMYDFDDQKTAMKAVRDVQKDEWADEVNKTYDYVIGILKDLETLL